MLQAGFRLKRYCLPTEGGCVALGTGTILSRTKPASNDWRGLEWSKEPGFQHMNADGRDGMRAVQAEGTVEE